MFLSHRFAVPVLLCSLPAAHAVAATDLWFHLRATEANGDRSRVTINLPFTLVEKMGPLMNDRSNRDHRIEINGREVTADELRQMWDAVKTQKDATIVSIVREGERVTVEKSGDALLIRSNERDRKSEVRLSGAVVAALLSSSDNQLNFSAALRAMATSGSGDIVVVRSDDSDVHIWVDSNPEGNEGARR